MVRRGTEQEQEGESGARRSFSRTGFLKVGAAVAATVGAGPLAQVASAAGAGRDAMAYLRLSTYKGLLNSTFTLHHPYGPMPAKLVEVSDLVARGSREQARRESFGLIFEAQRGEPLGQGTYMVEHASMGTFPLFLVPVGRGAKGFQLQAVVNRWLDSNHP